MQLSNTLLIVAAELYVALIIVVLILWLYSRRLKSIVRKQQTKVLDILRNAPAAKQTPAASAQNLAPSLTPVQHFKSYLNKEIEVTGSYFNSEFPGQDISSKLPDEASSLHRILALRYAFLRTEELGTTESAGTPEYWNIFKQALEPLLNTQQPESAALLQELETANKRIENLEKFKTLFFDMEKQWGIAQTTAQGYYNQLLALSQGMENSDEFGDLLNQYHGSFDDIHNLIINTTESSSPKSEQKVINITRQDPRAADEIMKLRNVAADQHRIINQLQRKLMDAHTSEEKEAVIKELEQQLQRQTRFVQESETCIKLLEEELDRIHEELHKQEDASHENDELIEENQKIKNALHGFTLESKDLISSINELEQENDALKNNTAGSATSASNPTGSGEVQKIQAEFLALKQQYAELEEKYLDLKLSK